MIRTGIGFDIHQYAAGRRLVLGGVEVPSQRGLAGHSDADVVCHAIADALLGAVADGDIGVHFPNTDQRWANANSLGLLKIVAERVHAKNAAIINVDATIIAEVPRICPHVAAMRRNLADAMGIGVDWVSIKATTSEGLGALGRAEGIAVMAVATVNQG